MLGLAIHYGKRPMLAERYKQPDPLIERLETYLGRSAPGHPRGWRACPLTRRSGPIRCWSLTRTAGS